MMPKNSPIGFSKKKFEERKKLVYKN